MILTKLWRVVAGILAMGCVVLGCSGVRNDKLPIAEAPPDSPDTLPVAEVQVDAPNIPTSDPLAGMWEPDPRFLGTRALEGILHIEHPCVYLLGTESGVILVGLPIEGTSYDADSESITVSDSRSVTSGYRVRIVGNYFNRDRPASPCEDDAKFNAWQLRPTTDPFVGMYDFPPDGPIEDVYSIGVLLIEPPCAYLLSHKNWRLPEQSYDVDAVVEMLSLPRDTQFDRLTSSVRTAEYAPVSNGDIVVVLPGLTDMNQWSGLCPTKTSMRAAYILPADDDEYRDTEERQYVEALRIDAAALFSPTAHQRPCAALNVCPRTPPPPSILGDDDATDSAAVDE